MIFSSPRRLIDRRALASLHVMRRTRRVSLSSSGRLSPRAPRMPSSWLTHLSQVSQVHCSMWRARWSPRSRRWLSHPCHSRRTQPLQPPAVRSSRSPSLRPTPPLRRQRTLQWFLPSEPITIHPPSPSCLRARSEAGQHPPQEPFYGSTRHLPGGAASRLRPFHAPLHGQGIQTRRCVPWPVWVLGSCPGADATGASD